MMIMIVVMMIMMILIIIIIILMNTKSTDENEYGRSPSNVLSSGLNQKLRCCVNTLSVDYMRNRRKRRLLEHTLDVSMNCNSFSALSDASVMMMMVMMIRIMMMVMMMIMMIYTKTLIFFRRSTHTAPIDLHNTCNKVQYST